MTRYIKLTSTIVAWWSWWIGSWGYGWRGPWTSSTGERRLWLHCVRYKIPLPHFPWFLRSRHNESSIQERRGQFLTELTPYIFKRQLRLPLTPPSTGSVICCVKWRLKQLLRSGKSQTSLRRHLLTHPRRRLRSQSRERVWGAKERRIRTRKRRLKSHQVILLKDSVVYSHPSIRMSLRLTWYNDISNKYNHV